MKILMFHGRAGGHNILPFLEYFNNCTEHELTFMYSNDRTYFPKKTSIRFLKFSFNPLKILSLSRVIRKKYDLIWYHGGHSAIILYTFSKLRNSKSTFVFNVWNEWLIKQAEQGGFKGRMFKYGISKADVVHCNWHGTADTLKNMGWNNNIKVFYWGLNQENFQKHKTPESHETRNFINSLSKDLIKFFFPKSISHNSRHDLVIEACYKLVDEGITNFIVYLWLGNTNESNLLNRYQEKILELNLERQIIIQSHGFLSFGDMQLIWREMDAGLQIAANEQLSTTFLEPLFYKKEIIVSNILPYRMFNEVFNLSIPLCDLNAKQIKNQMKIIIQGQRTKPKDLIKRSEIIKNNFNFSKNIEHILSQYK